MTPFLSADEIFAAALALNDPSARSAHLDRACAGDLALRQELESLLAAAGRAGSFLESPAAGAVEVLREVQDSAEGPLTEQAGDRIGRYRLLEQIGEGGFGVVWMAEQDGPVRRRVALKIIKLGMDTKEMVARFEAERQALALMDHPHIAKVFDGGAIGAPDSQLSRLNAQLLLGRAYFVMELVQGIPITRFCDERKLSTRERLELFRQVCHAVLHAHQKGVIHRDLKPSNILVTVQDGRPVPKVIDFGVAKATQARLTEKTQFTRFRQVIGTPAYMSPEQAGLASIDVDTRSDVYALGVLLYELLTGQTPFDTQRLLATGYEAVMRTIREEEPSLPSTYLTTLAADARNAVAASRGAEPAKLHRLVRGDLDWIVMKGLEKDRGRRYQTAYALALDLERHLNHQPVSAVAPTRTYRLARFIRRNRTPLAVAAGFALLLVSGTVVSVSQAVRADRARTLAEQREAEARENLWASYLAAARASRTSAQPGRRFGALEAVAKAAAIRPSPELRSEAASAMALVDVRTVREWEGLLPKTTGIVLGHRFERYARNHDEQGHISVRRVSDDRELLALEGKFAPVRFSPDGRFLLGTDCHPPRFGVWNLDTGQLVAESPMSGYCPGPDFHPHAPVLAACGTGGTVEFFDLAAGERRSWPATNIPPGFVRFRPDGKQVALSSFDPPAVRVYAVESGELVVSLAHTNAVRCVDWSADGQWLAAPCADGQVYLWNMHAGGAFDRVLIGHDELVSGVCFDPQGEFLLSRSWDGTTALWSLASHGLVLRLPGSDYPLAFSGDGRWLGPYVAGRIVSLLELERAPEHRVLPADTGAECNGAFNPDGRWVVVGGNGLQCWDPRTGQRLWTEPVGHVRYVAFRPDGGMLLTLSETGGREWPWLTDTASGHPRLGLPRRLTESWGSQAEYSRDGSVLVIAQRDGLWVSDSRALAPQVMPMPMCTFAAVSPDGQWAAGTSWGGMGMKVWELPAGREAFHLTNAFPTMGFTRDGRWLVAAREDVFQCLEVGTWRPVGDASRRHPRVFAQALPANSPWVAVEQGRRGLVQLCELPTLRPFLTLDSAGGFPLCFSPDEGWLLTRLGGGQFGLWNLGRIRNALAPQGLDW